MKVSLILAQFMIWVCVSLLLVQMGFDWSHWQYWAMFAMVWGAETNTQMFFDYNIKMAIANFKKEEEKKGDDDDSEV
jgi:hypothetical protein